jgi:hypothetical protein
MLRSALDAPFSAPKLMTRSPVPAQMPAVAAVIAMALRLPASEPPIKAV